MTPRAELDGLALPSWADTLEARDLLDSIVASPPEARITSGSWIEGGGRTIYRPWKRPDVAALKQLYEDWLRRQWTALEVQHSISGKWDQDAADAICRTEDPNELIERVLRPARADLTPKELPNGRFEVAA